MKNEKFQALFDEDSTQMWKELAKALNGHQSVVNRRLHGMGMIQKSGYHRH